MKPTKVEDLLFIACIALTGCFIVAITAFNYKQTNERLLLDLVKGAEMPYATFSRLSDVNQKIFIDNGGKISKE